MVFYTKTEQDIEKTTAQHSEAMVLSCAFIAPKLFLLLEEKIGDNWSSEVAKKIFLLALIDYKQYSMFDANLFGSKIQQEEQLYSYFLKLLIQTQVDISAFDAHIENILKKKYLSQVQGIIGKLTTLYQNSALSFSEITNSSEDIFLQGIKKTTNLSQICNITGNMEKIFASLMSKTSNFPDLRLLPPEKFKFRNGELTVLAARPSQGKTTFALNCFLDSIKTGLKTAFFSFEVPKESFTLKLISFLTRIDLLKLQEKNLSDKEKIVIKNSFEKMRNFQSSFIESSGMTLGKLKSIILNLFLKEGLDIVIIDYLGLIKANNQHNKFVSEHIEVSLIVAELKQLCCKLNIPILLLAQLNRTFDQQQQGQNSAPQLSSLKSSGGIEEHSDNVLFLVQNENNDSQIIIGKQRNGPKGSFDLIFRPEWSYFELK